MSVKMIALLSFVATCAVAGENLIVNADFAKTSGNGAFAAFEKRGEGHAELRDGALAIQCGPDQTLLLLQRKLQLVPGKSYRLAYDYRGKSGAPAVYLEYRNAQNQLKGFNTAPRKAAADWKSVSAAFRYPEKARDAYIVILASKGGDVEVRNLSLQDAGANK